MEQIKVLLTKTRSLLKSSSDDFDNGKELYVFLSIAIFSLIFGIYLRFRGIGWGIIDLPWLQATYHFDEDKVTNAIRNFSPFQWNVHDFRIGTFQFYLVAAALKVAEWIGYLAFYQQPHFDAAKVFVVGRLVSVMLGLLTIPLVYLTGKKVGGAKVGVLSAALFCFLPLHVINSHFTVPDVCMCFFVMLTFYITVLTFERGDKVVYSLQGLFCGLAIATKYSAAPIVVVIALSHLMRKDTGWRIKATTYPFMLLGFFIGEPYAFLSFSEFREELRVLRASHISGGGGHILSMVSNVWFYGKNVALYCMGLPAFIISLMGVPGLIPPIPIPTLLRGEGRGEAQVHVLVITSIVVFFLFAITSQFQFIRFSLPLIIFLCVPCAKYIVGVGDLRLRYTLIGLCILFPMVLSLRDVKIMTEEHTATSAYKWVDENVEPGSMLFQEWREIPPLQPGRYIVFDYTLVDSKSGLKFKPDYVIRTDMTPVFSNEQLLKQLDRDYELLASFEKERSALTLFNDKNVPQDLKYTRPKVSIYGLSATLAARATRDYGVDNNPIDFKDASSRKYLRRGWSITEDYGTWATGKESVLLVSVEGPGDYIMRVKATPYTVSGKEQHITMYVNDAFIGEHTFTSPFLQWEAFDVEIPAECLRAGTTAIRFAYRYATSPEELNRGPDIRKLAVAFDTIEFVKSGDRK